jgi:Tol biopolymer transport system component
MQRSSTIFLFVLLFIALLSISNIAQENKSQLLIGDEDNYFMHPVWSPDGSKIAYTGSNYNGLWVMSVDGNNPIQLSNEAAAGWGFEWSTDSKSILSRVAKFENYRRLNAVKYFDIENGKSNQLTEYKSFMPSLPHWIEFDQNILIFNKKSPEKINSYKSIERLNKSDYPQFTCFLRGNKIAIYDNNTSEFNTINPLNASGYLNPVISKDGNKIAFEEYGGNLYVMNLDGTNLVDLGIGYSPHWSPDNKNLVYTISEDNGHQFTSSDIYIINTETLEKNNITNTNEQLEMHPNWSPDGKSILFDESNSGMIYLLEL